MFTIFLFNINSRSFQNIFLFQLPYLFETNSKKKKNSHFHSSRILNCLLRYGIQKKSLEVLVN